MDIFEEKTLEMLKEFVGVNTSCNLYGQSVAYYNAMRKLNLSSIFTQVPYIVPPFSVNHRYGDLTLYLPDKKIFHRIECKTLREYGSLSFSIMDVLSEFNTIQEDKMIFILFGDGFTPNTIRSINELAVAKKVTYTVEIFRTIEEYRNHLEGYT